MAAVEMSIEQLEEMLEKKRRENGDENQEAAKRNIAEVEVDGLPITIDLMAAASYRAHKVQKRFITAQKAYEANKNDNDALMAANQAMDEYYELLFGADQLDRIAEHAAERKGCEPSYEDVIRICNDAMERANVKK